LRADSRDSLKEDNMRSHQFLAYCLATPWAMDRQAMSAYAAILARAYAKRDGISADIEGSSPAPMAVAPKTGSGRQGGIAVIGVYGTIVQRASQLGMCEGGTSTQQIRGALQSAIADETISQILVEFDTPGGSVFDINTLAADMRDARSKKPLVGIANSQCGSAGFWLLSQCSEAYCAPGGQVGSKGVWMAHEDISKSLVDAGIDVTLISSGKYKVEGHPFGPLADETKAFLQASTDDYLAMFDKDVAKGRGLPIEAVRGQMGDGRMLSASAALDAKMIDGIASFDQVVRNMQAKMKPKRSAMADAQNRISLVA
jgi:capsid assembly protease